MAAPQIGLFGIGIDNADSSPLTGRLWLSPTNPDLMCSLREQKAENPIDVTFHDGSDCEARMPSFTGFHR
jgi:hypothetical protein